MSQRAILIQSLGATPRDLQRMLRRVTPEQALLRVAPDAWCIADVVAHLGYAEGLYLARLRRIVAEDNPAEPPLPHDPGHDLSAPLGELTEAFVSLRAETLAFLSGLAQRDWARTFAHPTMGARRLREQVQAIVAHDNEHLAQIAELRERLA